MASIGNTPTTQSFISGSDQFSGTGAQTAFTLSRTVNAVQDIEVVVANVIQNPYTAYSVSGTTLTFTSAPVSGTNNIYVVYRATNTQQYTPQPLSVSPSALTTGGPSWNVSGNLSDVAGNVRSIPQNAQTSAYILAATDNGKHISITTGGVTVNSSIFSVGQTVVIFNNSASSQTITQGSGVTLYNAADASTGNRTLGARGLATILCVASNVFTITGAGLT